MLLGFNRIRQELKIVCGDAHFATLTDDNNPTRNMKAIKLDDVVNYAGEAQLKTVDYTWH